MRRSGVCVCVATIVYLMSICQRGSSICVGVFEQASAFHISFRGMFSCCRYHCQKASQSAQASNGGQTWYTLTFAAGVRAWAAPVVVRCKMWFMIPMMFLVFSGGSSGGSSGRIYTQTRNFSLRFQLLLHIILSLQNTALLVGSFCFPCRRTKGF